MSSEQSALRFDGDAIAKAALALVPEIEAARDEIEQGRRLPLHLVNSMRRAGIFAMPMPKAWGGPELDPLSQLRIWCGEGSVQLDRDPGPIHRGAKRSC